MIRESERDGSLSARVPAFWDAPASSICAACARGVTRPCRAFGVRSQEPGVRLAVGATVGERGSGAVELPDGASADAAGRTGPRVPRGDVGHIVSDVQHGEDVVVEPDGVLRHSPVNAGEVVGLAEAAPAPAIDSRTGL